MPGNGKTFRARLWRYPGPGGWTFARIPAAHAPPATHAWGRAPVHATVDGHAWATSVWRDREHGTLLPVPKRLLRGKSDGDTVTVALRPRDWSLPRRPACPGSPPSSRPPGCPRIRMTGP